MTDTSRFDRVFAHSASHFAAAGDSGIATAHPALPERVAGMAACILHAFYAPGAADFG
jgi:hypothetical protein